MTKKEGDRKMNILRLEARNIKALKAVEIQADGKPVIIAGKNGAGKTSVLDSILFALEGPAGKTLKSTKEPVRRGQKDAEICVDLGDIIVRRKWKGDNVYLSVEDAEGNIKRSPQALLDSLLGRFVDPARFSVLTEKEQLALVLDLTGAAQKMAALDEKHRKFYEARREAGRVLKIHEGELAALPAPPKDLPQERVDIAAISNRLAFAQKQQLSNAAARQRHDELLQRRAEIKQQIADLTGRLENIEASIEASAATCAKLVELDSGLLQKQLAAADGINRQIDAAEHYRKAHERCEELRREHKQQDHRVERVAQEKRDLLAGAKLPVDGLQVSEDGTALLYNGIPFSQCSWAERLRVSIAMGMALSPGIRVLLVDEGSNLDEDNLALLFKMCEENNFQPWVVRVEEGKRPAVLIEAGELAGG